MLGTVVSYDHKFLKVGVLGVGFYFLTCVVLRVKLPDLHWGVRVKATVRSHLI